MIERQRVRELATPKPRAYPGFAVAHEGRLLVDTIRPHPVRAKEAAIERLHTSGVRWAHLLAQGYEIVSVSISVLDTYP